MNSYIIVSFYKFVSLENYEALREPILNTMKTNTIKGTIILASEGINGSFCGLREEVNTLMAQLKIFLSCDDIAFKETYDEFNPFDKAKVKLRKEIVTIGVEEIDPNNLPGVHLSPEEWNELLNDPEVILIDTRNEYEIELGTFKNAISPKTVNFRDFPDYVQKNLITKKDKKIAMYCTGGIRCEKSTSYLRQLGFNEVYQLNGGILNYLDTIKDDESLWEGSCFVFDNRIALDKN